MTLLSRKADYALLIVSYLHQRPEGGNARSIAERFGLSRPFVANILKELCQKGYVASHRGVKGGYEFLKSASHVSLADFLASIDEGFRLTLCNTSTGVHDSCTVEQCCPLKGPLGVIHKRIIDVLCGVTLIEVVSPPPIGLASPTQSLLPMLATPEGICCSHHTHTLNLQPEPTTI